MTEVRLPRWKVRLIKRLKKKRPRDKVSWVRIGKCASCSTKKCLRGISNKDRHARAQLGGWRKIKHHHQGEKNEITFAVIRDPTGRVASGIRFKLRREDTLLRVPEPARTKLRNGASMDEVIESLSDGWLRKQPHYARYENVDVYLRIEEVPHALKLLLGLNYEPVLPTQNKTTKHTDVRNVPVREPSTIERLKRVRSSDYEIWERWGAR